jgi:hypothetical protein
VGVRVTVLVGLGGIGVTVGGSGVGVAAWVVGATWVGEAGRPEPQPARKMARKLR